MNTDDRNSRAKDALEKLMVLIEAKDWKAALPEAQTVRDYFAYAMGADSSLTKSFETVISGIKKKIPDQAD